MTPHDPLPPYWGGWKLGEAKCSKVGRLDALRQNVRFVVDIQDISNLRSSEEFQILSVR